jgi:tRNA dimethylallyltransferase
MLAGARPPESGALRVCLAQFTAHDQYRSALMTLAPSATPAVVAIYGCTGVGKTDFSIALAQRLNGEVVNADSRYLYRRLRIGVAKPTHEQLKSVRHHLVDVLDPGERAYIPLVQQMAYEAIDDILSRDRLPILVGGTPLYMNAITEGWKVPEVPPDPEFRKSLEVRIARDGLEPVQNELAAVDPVAAERSGANPRRVIRALEIHAATGRPMSAIESKSEPPYQFIHIGLGRDRDLLRAEVAKRVDDQIAAGLVDEVRGLLESGLTGSEPAFSAIGYRQLLPFLSGEIDLESAIAQIKRDTNRYIRHQSTWLRRRTDIAWFDTGEPGWREVAFALIDSQLAQRKVG